MKIKEKTALKTRGTSNWLTEEVRQEIKDRLIKEHAEAGVCMFYSDNKLSDDMTYCRYPDGHVEIMSHEKAFEIAGIKFDG